MRPRGIFSNRWLAILWAAGIILFAWQFASDGDSLVSSQGKITDATGAPVDDQQIEDLQNSIDAM